MNFIDANSVEYTPDKWLAFDDVMLVPKPSDLDSRNDPKINLSAKFTSKLWLPNPIIAANMDTVTGPEMVKALYSQGCYGILHRFFPSKEEYLNAITDVYNNTKGVAISIGATPSDVDIVEEILNTVGQQNIIVCVDVAHGHLTKCSDQVARLRRRFDQRIQIIAGNICTAAAAADLIGKGVDAIKVGVGNGSMCTTRLVTGHGIPQLSAIMQCRRAINAMRTNTALIADGGIRHAGDIVKALAAGADSVMVGNLLAATTEAPGELYGYVADDDKYVVVNQNHTLWKMLYKKYRGQSSQNFMEDIGKTNVAPEGEHEYLPYRGSVAPIVKQLIQGIRSGLTYSGCSTIEELSQNATFIEITDHGYTESTPHGKIGY